MNENNLKKIFNLLKNHLASTIGNVENKTSAEIRAELTKANVTDALGYTPSKDVHTHGLSDVTNLQSSLDSKVPTTRKVNGKALSGDVTLSASDVGAASSSHNHDDKYYTESEIDTKLNAKLNTSLKGAASGLAELDASGKVPSSQLPSYVDDTVEGYLNSGKFYKESGHTTVITGESSKIYIDLHTNKTYRWSGSAYVEISASLALGETSSTAYRGDRGKTAYDHSQAAHAPSSAEKNVIVGIQKNGTDLTVNSSTRKVNITVPTKTSELTNDSSFLTSHQDISGKLDKTGDASNVTNTFSTASSRTNISTGEKLSVSLGKIAKFFTDLKTVAFSGSYNDLSNKPTVLTGGSQTTTSSADGGSNVYTFTKSDGTTSTLTVKNGSKGSTGAQGTKGDTGAAGVGISSVKQTTTSSADGGTNVVTVTLTNGTTSTFNVKNGTKGSSGTNGTNGTNGTRGSLWYSGTSVTGTSTTGTVFSGTGISSALVNDYYLNTSTGYVYKCTTAGAASAAKWAYVGSIKGATGANGTNATTTATATQSANGLMSSADKTKLDGIATGANKYEHPSSGVTAGTYRSVTVNANGHVTAGSNPTITVAQGGTGATTAKEALYNITSGMVQVTTATGDDTQFSCTYTAPSVSNGRLYYRTALNVWEYIKSKISSVLGLTVTSYGGNAASATKVNGHTVNADVPSGAKFTDTIYTHLFYTARTGKPTANQTPAFGGTATISQITSDATGHVTAATDRTITIPSTLSNGTGTAGLIKTTSTVTNNSGYTACPVISGVPYYKDTSTGTDGINMRYNPTNDTIEIYYNGVWNKWRVAKLQVYPINFITETIATDYTMGATAVNLTIGDTFVSNSTSTSSANGYALYKDKLPISEGAILNVKGKIDLSVGTMPGTTQTGYFQVQFSTDEGSTWTNVTNDNCTIKSAYSANKSFTHTNVDLSSYAGYDVMFRVRTYSTLSGITVKTTLTQFDIVYPSAE